MQCIRVILFKKDDIVNVRAVYVRATNEKEKLGNIMPGSKPHACAETGREIEDENIAYVDKAEKIAPEDREHVRCELAWLAEWVRKRYSAMNYSDLRKFINGMLTVSV